jgi:protein-tyrosine phosphatase
VPPDKEAEQACEEALPHAQAILEAELDLGNRALVHCVAGRDRTGMLLTYHLARSLRIEPDAALAQLREVRPNAIAAEGWEPMALRVVARLLAAP